MFPEKFTSLTLYQKKKNIIIYKAADASKNYILKGIITEDGASRQAFYDEYRSLSVLQHPMIPRYYGLKDSFILPEGRDTCLMLCMECCQGQSLTSYTSLTLGQITDCIISIGELLDYLLRHGILYTDLNPSNIIMDEAGSIHLIDYSFCYYYDIDPDPAYPLRFSYDLDLSVKAQQLLIQELSQLLMHLLEKNATKNLPSGLFLLLETGLHPTEELTLLEYVDAFRKL